MSETRRGEIPKLNEELAGQALRTLWVAFRPLDAGVELPACFETAPVGLRSDLGNQSNVGFREGILGKGLI